MTNEKGCADLTRDDATHDPAPDPRRWTDVLKYHSATLGESA